MRKTDTVEAKRETMTREREGSRYLRLMLDSCWSFKIKRKDRRKNVYGILLEKGIRSKSEGSRSCFILGMNVCSCHFKI